MIKRKNVKSRGKLRLSQYFQEFNEGERVAVIREHSLNPAFPIRLQGRSGVVIGQKGNAYIIKIMDGKQEKIHIIAPAHLQKLESEDKQKK